MSVPVITEIADALAEARQRTLAMVEPFSDEQVETAHSALMSPLAWDLAHIAAYEDLWLVHRHGGEPLLHPELAAMYDAFETPRAVRGDLPILNRAEAVDYLAGVRSRALAILEREGPGDVHEMVLQHEHQHNETMLQAIELAQLPTPPGLTPAPRRTATPGATGLEPVDIPAGPFTMGAPDERFSYDNERPRHTVQVDAFRIARRPVSVAEFTGAGDPDTPMVHVTWDEADAFARSRGARLPTEREWERAARLGVLGDTGLVWEWTASEFTGYPGFVAHPYREYSEVFFDSGYRVLRGGAWTTHPRVATPSFRNWDLPERRQIFAGLRLVEGD